MKYTKIIVLIVLITSLFWIIGVVSYSVHGSGEKIEEDSVLLLSSYLNLETFVVEDFLDHQDELLDRSYNKELFVEFLSMSVDDPQYSSKAEEIDEWLSDLKVSRSGLTDKDGVIVIADIKEFLGTDLSESPSVKSIREHGRAYDTYPELENNVGIGIGLAVLDPTNKEFLGTYGFNINLVSLRDRLDELYTSPDLYETYIVSSANLLLTSSKFSAEDEKGVLIQSIDAETIKECFGEHAHLEGEEGKSNSYTNYRGEEVQGLHQHIERTNWCIISEVNVNRLKDNEIKMVLYEYLFIISLIFMFVLMVGFLIGLLVDNRNKRLDI